MGVDPSTVELIGTESGSVLVTILVKPGSSNAKSPDAAVAALYTLLTTGNSTQLAAFGILANVDQSYTPTTVVLYGCTDGTWQTTCPDDSSDDDKKKLAIGIGIGLGIGIPLLMVVAVVAIRSGNKSNKVASTAS